MGKQAVVVLSVQANPTQNLIKRTFNVTIDGVVQAPVEVTPDVLTCTITVPASKTFSFTTTVTDGTQSATMDPYSATLGDLTVHPDAGAAHQVTSITDVPDAPAS